MNDDFDFQYINPTFFEGNHERYNPMYKSTFERKGLELFYLASVSNLKYSGNSDLENFALIFDLASK